MCRSRAASRPAKTDPIEFKDGRLPKPTPTRALDKLTKLVDARSRTRRSPTARWCMPMWKNRYGTYDHLARVKEWSVGGEEEEEW